MAAWILESMMVSVYDTLYVAGKDSSLGSKLLAAVLFWYPHRGSTGAAGPPARRQGAPGIEEKCPGTKKPLPLLVVAALAVRMMVHGHPKMALCLLVMVDTYLRPTELHHVGFAGDRAPARRGDGVRGPLDKDCVAQAAEQGGRDRRMLAHPQAVAQRGVVAARQGPAEQPGAPVALRPRGAAEGLAAGGRAAGRGAPQRGAVHGAAHGCQPGPLGGCADPPRGPAARAMADGELGPPLRKGSHGPGGGQPHLGPR